MFEIESQIKKKNKKKKKVILFHVVFCILICLHGMKWMQNFRNIIFSDALYQQLLSIHNHVMFNYADTDWDIWWSAFRSVCSEM